MSTHDATGSYFPEGMPLPEARADGLDRPFYDAAREHRLVVQRCAACGNAQFPPEVVCIACRSHDLAWEEVPSTGTLTSFARVWHPVHPALADRCPYLIAVVELVPGVRLVGNIVGDATRTDLTLDMPMRAVFEDHDDVTLIQWDTA
ncbi:MAG: OB-fold domain-containing protein [Acidimicrobiia bacterium]